MNENPEHWQQTGSGLQPDSGKAHICRTSCNFGLIYRFLIVDSGTICSVQSGSPRDSLHLELAQSVQFPNYLKEMMNALLRASQGRSR